MQLDSYASNVSQYHKTRQSSVNLALKGFSQAFLERDHVLVESASIDNVLFGFKLMVYLVMHGSNFFKV